MDLYYATTKKPKFESMQRHLRIHLTLRQWNYDVPEPRSGDVQEIGVAKVKYAYNILRNPVIASDVGFYIHALNGFPRAYVDFALETIKLEGILELLSIKSNRSCEFRECLAYMDASLHEPRVFFGFIPGSVALVPRGERKDHLWSELPKIFIPKGGRHTLAELTMDQYARWESTCYDPLPPGQQLLDWLKSTGKIKS